MDEQSSSRFISAGTALDGLEITPGRKNVDDRGSFTEVFCKEWGLGIEPTQWSIVESAPRVLRGMHLHKRHDEYFTLLRGRACIGLYDVRPTSPTFRCSCLIDLTENEPVFVTFPRGIIHGWYFYEGSMHLQAVSESYVSYSRDDNIRCSWADPELGIPWPDTDPVVSDLAAGAGSVTECIEVMQR